MLSIEKEIERIHTPSYRSCVLIVDTTDEQRRVVFATQSISEMFGVPAATLIGRPINHLLAVFLSAEAADLLHDAVSAQETHVSSVQVLRRDGKSNRYMAKTSAWHDQSGQMRRSAIHLKSFSPVDPRAEEISDWAA